MKFSKKELKLIANMHAGGQLLATEVHFNDANLTLSGDTEEILNIEDETYTLEKIHQAGEKLLNGHPNIGTTPEIVKYVLSLREE